MKLQLTDAARANVNETGCDPEADLAEIRRCGTTRDEFLQFCLNGADRDRVQGWHDYVDALFALVEPSPDTDDAAEYAADRAYDQAKDDALTGDR